MQPHFTDLNFSDIIKSFQMTKEMENLPQSFSSLRSSQSKKPSQKLSEGTHCPELHRRPTHSVTAKKIKKELCIKSSNRSKSQTIFDISG